MDVAFEFTPLAACKLIIFTLGSLVHLFLMVLILGQRRLRRLEWLLFALMAALFMWNSGNLLGLNVDLFYGFGQVVLSGFSRLIPFVGLVLIPPLMLHVHGEYAAQFRPGNRVETILILLFYLPLAGAPWMVSRILSGLALDPLTSIRGLIRPLILWLVLALGASAVFNIALARRLEAPSHFRFHLWLAALEGFLAAGLAWVYFYRPLPSSGLGGYPSAFLMLVAVVPSALVGYAIFRHNFLDLRVQRNLVYALVSIFALLAYLNVIRRLSVYLEVRDILPSTATESVMIFILVVLFEPVRRRINRALRAAFVSEFESVQKLSAEIQEFAKQSGNVEALKQFVRQKMTAQLGVHQAELRLENSGPGAENSAGRPAKARAFPIHRGNEVMGYLDVVPVTPELSGEQAGALQLLADQMAAAIELCQLIAAKVELERELAEKAKMAFLGEMAARIAHNVKNPLSSMKTLVQLLEEDASLPERVRRDCHMVASEIDRLNANISQVLRYAKPARDTDRPADLAAVAGRVIALTRADAERREVRLEFVLGPEPCPVQGGEEAASDIVSNLVVNALQASAPGGKIRVALDRSSPGRVELHVEDEGSGIPADMKEKVFQPFFTTRPGGTGLGLAIVARRAEEIGGSAEFTSPLSAKGGTRFTVRFRVPRVLKSEVPSRISGTSTRILDSGLHD